MKTFIATLAAGCLLVATPWIKGSDLDWGVPSDIQKTNGASTEGALYEGVTVQSGSRVLDFASIAPKDFVYALHVFNTNPDQVVDVSVTSIQVASPLGRRPEEAVAANSITCTLKPLEGKTIPLVTEAKPPPYANVRANVSVKKGDKVLKPVPIRQSLVIPREALGDAGQSSSASRSASQDAETFWTGKAGNPKSASKGPSAEAAAKIEASARFWTGS